MTEQKNGVFVNLVKKAVGLPTGGSGCCGGTGAVNASTCCDAATTAASESACCGSADAVKESACCGAEQVAAKPAGGSCCG
ncbi:MAG: hypothetical protein ACM3XM_10800 [Mycobacterium leprae]